MKAHKLWFLLFILFSSRIMHSYEFLNSDQKSIINLDDYKGKLILIVNIASKCGFANQLNDLEKLHQKYKEKGLVVIAVPSNDFKQEYLKNNELQNFCSLNKLTFQVTTKYAVTSKNSHPLFNDFREKFSFFAGPLWNYYKYFIGPNGELLAWFSPLTNVNSDKMTNFIESNLPKTL